MEHQRDESNDLHNLINHNSEHDSAEKLTKSGSTVGMTDEEFWQIGDRLYKEVEIKKRTFRFTDYKNVFVGSEAVDWMINKAKIAKDELQAIEIGDRMIKLGIFAHCVRDHGFKNDYYFYRFLKDDKDRGHVPENNGAPKKWGMIVQDHQDKILTTELIRQTNLGTLTDYHLKNDEVPELLMDKLNAELLDSVRPIRWEDPSPEPIYNMVAIGAGAGGLVSSLAIASLGGKAAICEKGMFGGDCLNTGCVPSKALIKAAKVAHTVRNAAKYGVKIGSLDIDFKEVMKGLREKRAHIGHHDACKRFIKDYGIDVFLGHAKFISKDTIEVNGKKLKFARAVVATGGRPRVPEVKGIDKVYYYTSENLFNLNDRPKNVVVIGGGPIGAELGQSLQRLGCQVTFLLRSSRFLSKEDPEAGELLRKILESEGCKFHSYVRYQRIEPAGSSESSPPNIEKPSKCKIYLERSRENFNRPLVLDCDCLILAAGRIPNTHGLGLEAAGIEYSEKRGVHINSIMRTTNSKVYAVGDCCHKLQFTHMADAMARAVVKNSCFFGSVKHTDLIVPRVTYTEPEVAQVGLNKVELGEEGIEFSEYVLPFEDNDRAICDGQREGFVKMYTEKGTGKILGCVIVCERAGEMIGEVALAMVAKVDLSSFSATIHPYPTYGENLRKCGDKYMGTKLNTNAKVLLRRLLKLRR